MFCPCHQLKSPSFFHPSTYGHSCPPLKSSSNVSPGKASQICMWGSVSPCSLFTTLFSPVFTLITY